MGLSILNPYEFKSIHNSYQYTQKISEQLQKIETFQSFMEQYNDLLQSLTEFMDHYQTIFNVYELEKWSLMNMESSVFQRNIYPQIDQLDDTIEYKKQLLIAISNKLGLFIDKKKEDIVKIGCNDKYGWHLYMTKTRSQKMKKSFHFLRKNLN